MQPQKMAEDSMPEVMKPKNLQEWFSQLKYRLGETSLTFYGILGYLFLYTPIVILVIFSFNDSRSTAQWSGFSTHWYGEMIHDEQIILALWNSLFVAIVSTVISTDYRHTGCHGDGAISLPRKVSHGCSPVLADHHSRYRHGHHAAPVF